MLAYALGLAICDSVVGSEWTPNLLSNLAAGFVTPVATGKLSSWADSSGNGRPALQATSANQPTVTAGAGPNGGAAVVFSGGLSSGDYMQTASWGLAGPLTIWIIMSTGVQTFEQDFVDGLSGNTARFALVGSSKTPYIDGGVFLIGSAWSDVSAFHLYEVVFNGASGGKIAQDGVTNVTGNAGSSVGANGLTIGTYGGLGVDFASTSLVELWCQSGVATALDEANMHTYSKAKYSTP